MVLRESYSPWGSRTPSTSHTIIGYDHWTSPPAGDCKSSDLHYCVCHPVESKKFKIKMKLTTTNRKTTIHTETRVLKDIPVACGPKGFLSKPITVSKGIALDHFICHLASNITCEHAFAHQQSAEMHSIEKGEYTLHEINPSVLRAFKLDAHISALKHPPRTCKNVRNRTVKVVKRKSTSKHQPPRQKFSQQPCVISIDKKKDGSQLLTCGEVISQTGFQDIRELLFYVAVICSADFAAMTTSCSYLSWLEEWFFRWFMVVAVFGWLI